MASFVGTFDEFIKYISPRARNVVNGISRQYKKKVGRCEECNSTTTTLEAAHVTGKERPVIIEEILTPFINGETVTIDLDLFESKFLAAHEPIEKVIRVLCRTCHRAYDAPNQVVHETLPQIEVWTEQTTNPDAPIITNSEITSYFRQTVITLSEEIVTKLLNDEYCKRTFDVNFPVLKKVPFNADRETIRKYSRNDNGYIRWSPQNTIERTGSRYLVLTQWYDRNRLPFVQWKQLIDNKNSTA